MQTQLQLNSKSDKETIQLFSSQMSSHSLLLEQDLFQMNKEKKKAIPQKCSVDDMSKITGCIYMYLYVYIYI